MKLLLDSHVFIWMDSEPKKLSTPVQQAIRNPQNEIYLSLVSIWEMQIKMQLGKLKLHKPFNLNRRQMTSQFCLCKQVIFMHFKIYLCIMATLLIVS